MDKRKRYFCDWIDNLNGFAFAAIIAILSVLVVILALFTHYNITIRKYNEQINAYPEETYQYLEEIEIVEVDAKINLRYFLDNVFIINVDYDENNNLKICYGLKKSASNFKYGISPTITITLSSNGEILSKTRNISSAEKYVQIIKLNIIESYSSITMPAIIVVFMFFGVILVILEKRSREKKKLLEPCIICLIDDLDELGDEIL